MARSIRVTVSGDTRHEGSGPAVELADLAVLEKPAPPPFEVVDPVLGLIDQAGGRHRRRSDGRRCPSPGTAAQLPWLAVVGGRRRRGRLGRGGLASLRWWPSSPSPSTVVVAEPVAVAEPAVVVPVDWLPVAAPVVDWVAVAAAVDCVALCPAAMKPASPATLATLISAVTILARLAGCARLRSGGRPGMFVVVGSMLHVRPGASEQPWRSLRLGRDFWSGD